MCVCIYIYIYIYIYNMGVCVNDDKSIPIYYNISCDNLLVITRISFSAVIQSLSARGNIKKCSIIFLLYFILLRPHFFSLDNIFKSRLKTMRHILFYNFINSREMSDILFKIYIPVYIYIYLPLRSGRIWHKVNFLKQSLTGLNPEFPFS